MQIGNILQASRVDILLAGQASGATALFIYSGEVGCNFASGNDITLNDQLQINLPDGDLTAGQIVGFEQNFAPAPVVLPSSWNSNGNSSVIAVDSPRLNVDPNVGHGLSVNCNVAVQNGQLLRVSYQVSVRVSL